MNNGIRFTDEFERDAVAQVGERGYAVSEVAERLGISTNSLYTWKAQILKSPHVRSEVAEQAAEIRRLQRELARVTEKRTILKKATVSSTGQRDIFDLRSSERTYDGTNRSPWLVT